MKHATLSINIKISLILLCTIGAFHVAFSHTNITFDEHAPVQPVNAITIDMSQIEMSPLSQSQRCASLDPTNQASLHRALCAS